MSRNPKPNLTKKEISERVFQRASGLSLKESRAAVELTLEALEGALAEGRNVELRNFGVFHLQRRKARVGRNPANPNDTVHIPERVIVKFRIGKVLGHRLEELAAKEPAELKPAELIEQSTAA